MTRNAFQQKNIHVRLIKNYNDLSIDLPRSKKKRFSRTIDIYQLLSTEGFREWLSIAKRKIRKIASTQASTPKVIYTTLYSSSDSAEHGAIYHIVSLPAMSEINKNISTKINSFFKRSTKDNIEHTQKKQ